MALVKLLISMTQRGVEVAAGAEIELSDRSAASAVESGHAEYVDASSGGQNGGAKASNGSGGSGGSSGDPEEEARKLADALEAKYNLDDGGQKPGIKAAAAGVGVDFAYDAKKSEIIAAVIAAGKAEALLTEAD